MPNRSSVSEQSHINKPQPKDIEPKDSTDYRELNKEFDEMDKNAMVISVFNLENEASVHKKRKLMAIKKMSAHHSTMDTPSNSTL